MALILAAAVPALVPSPSCHWQSMAPHRLTIVALSKEPEEKRLVPRTDDPRLFWLDELFDTPTERAARDKEKQENMAKWGRVLSGADTFDDELLPDDEESTAEMKSVGGIPADWLLVAGSSLVLLACAAAASAAEVVGDIGGRDFLPTTDGASLHVVARVGGTSAEQRGAPTIFPGEDAQRLPTALLASDASTGMEEEEEEGKSRGRLILAAIVCNSVFWQYLFPTLKGEENALGKMLGQDARPKGRE